MGVFDKNFIHSLKLIIFLSNKNWLYKIGLLNSFKFFKNGFLMFNLILTKIDNKLLLSKLSKLLKNTYSQSSDSSNLYNSLSILVKISEISLMFKFLIHFLYNSLKS